MWDYKCPQHNTKDFCDVTGRGGRSVIIYTLNCIHLIKNRWFNCVLKIFQVGHSRHLYIHNIAMQFNWYFIGPRSKWTIKFSMPYQCGATTNTRKEMVHGAIGDHSIWRPLAVRFHLYWSVNNSFFFVFHKFKAKIIS